MVEFSSLILQMKRWQFEDTELIQYHVVLTVSGRDRTCSRLVEVSSLGFHPHIRLLPEMKISTAVQLEKGLGGSGGLSGKNAELSYYTQPGACGQGHSLHSARLCKWKQSELLSAFLFSQNGHRKCLQISYKHWPGRMDPALVYNWKTSECESFNFGGCYGNSNNFEKKTECEETCKKPDFLISLPSPEPGLLQSNKLFCE